MHEILKNSFVKEKAKDRVLCSKRIRNADSRTAQTRSKIILGNTKRDAKRLGDQMQHGGLPIPGISLSTVQEQDEQRQHTVAKLIEKFESHKYKEQFLQDMSQT